MLRHARRFPKLHAIGDIAVWLEGEIYRRGVDVRLSTYMDADEVLAERADAVILATGSRTADGPIRQVAVPGATVAVEAGAVVLDSVALVQSRPRPLGRHAVVLDDIGHYEAIAACEELLERGLDVTYVSRLPGFVPMIEATYRTDAALRRLHALGELTIMPQSMLISVGKGEAMVRPLYGARARAVPADVVLRIDYRAPCNALWDSLRGRQPELHLVGDALSVRDLQAAIREGHLAARGID
jgi:hypothetical protein